jgi:hypothetical protein
MLFSPILVCYFHSSPDVLLTALFSDMKLCSLQLETKFYSRTKQQITLICVCFSLTVLGRKEKSKDFEYGSSFSYRVYINVELPANFSTVA